jgi:hypothetical protein
MSTSRNLSQIRPNQLLTPHPISPVKHLTILYTGLHLGISVHLFPSEFTIKTIYVHCIFPTLQSNYATCPAHLILFDLIILIKAGEECKSRSSCSCSFHHQPGTSSPFGKNILFSALFSNTYVYILSINLERNFRNHREQLTELQARI